MRTTTAAVLCAAVSALGLVLVTGPVRAQARPDLSGTWRLNEKESDNPREKLREGTRRGGRGGGFPGGGGMGGRGGGFPGGGRRGGFGGGEGGPGTDGPGMRGPARFERMEEHYRMLQIRHQEPALEVEYGDERGETFYTDGRKVKRDGGDSRLVEVQARWKDNRVVVERETGRGKATETFELSPDGRRLIVTTRRGGPMGSLTIKRVYDADAGETPPPEGPPPAPPSGGR